jgi:NAD(P)-dependent dehydrogenase (short-subunit alcohol dehydrogenase family)
MKIDLAGKAALVVGSGGAIKSAVAETLAENGAEVIEARLVAGRAAELVVAGKGIPLAAGAADVLARLPSPPRVLVHVSAGAETGPVEPPPALTDAESLAALVRALSSSLHRVVHVMSVAGVVPVRRAPIFSAAQAALASLTRSLAMELGGVGVAVNGLAVGAFAVGEVRAAEGLLTHAAVKRPAELSEIMAALCFLADPANSYTTGHIINVDGGWSAGYARNF